MRSIPFTVVPGDYAVCRLGSAAAVPAWATGSRGSFVSVTRTEEELSIVAPGSSVPQGEPGLRVEREWALLKLVGPFAFSEIGVVASIAAPLAAAGISLFAVSTFDTDYLLVKADRLESAIATLEAAGHRRL